MFYIVYFLYCQLLTSRRRHDVALVPFASLLHCFTASSHRCYYQNGKCGERTSARVSSHSSASLCVCARVLCFTAKSIFFPPIQCHSKNITASYIFFASHAYFIWCSSFSSHFPIQLAFMFCSVRLCAVVHSLREQLCMYIFMEVVNENYSADKLYELHVMRTCHLCVCVCSWMGLFCVSFYFSPAFCFLPMVFFRFIFWLHLVGAATKPRLDFQTVCHSLGLLISFSVRVFFFVYMIFFCLLVHSSCVCVCVRVCWTFFVPSLLSFFLWAKGLVYVIFSMFGMLKRIQFYVSFLRSFTYRTALIFVVSEKGLRVCLHEINANGLHT